jgi:hypothetical protein
MFPAFFKKSFTGLIILLSVTTIQKINYAQNILPETIRSCKVDSLLVDAGSGYDTYTWSTGDTSQAIWVSIMGDYWVNVTQGDTVSVIDSVFVVIVDAQITEDFATMQCGDSVSLYGSSGQFDYIWYLLGENVGTGDSITVFPRDSLYSYSDIIYYYAQISDPVLNFAYCVDSIRVDIEPVIFVDTLIQLKMGCPDSPTAEVEVFVSGGNPPYTYQWSEGKPYSDIQQNKAYNLTDGEITVTITDTIGCMLRHEFEVKAYPLPEITMTSVPADTVYLQNPYVNFSYENLSYDSLAVDTFYLVSFWWDFLGIDTLFLYEEESPTYVYSNTGTYEVYFHYRTFYDCVDSNNVHIQIVVEPVKLKATSVITPNDDGFNDLFEFYEDEEDQTGGTGGDGSKSTYSSLAPIDLSKYYLSNTLLVFNRWGQRVYEADNYQNDWDAKGIKDGVYFYILKCTGYYEDKTYNGAVSVFTGQ